jgi:hypothetical protein
MAAGELEQLARIAAIAAGIIFGSWALSSVIWVWTKKQIYAYGGSALSVVGIVLMGLSIYKTVDVRAAPDGIGIKLADVLEKALKEQAEAQKATQTKLAQLPSDIGPKLAEVEKALKEQAEAQKATQTKLAQLPPDIGPKLVELDKTIKEQSSVQAAQLRNWNFQNSYDPDIRYSTGAKSATTAISTNDHKATAPMKMDFVKSDDGKTSMMVFMPDFANPAYIEQLQKEISEATKKYGPSHISLVSLYMSLGNAYLSKDDRENAAKTYETGIQILKASK